MSATECPRFQRPRYPAEIGTTLEPIDDLTFAAIDSTMRRGGPAFSERLHVGAVMVRINPKLCNYALGDFT